MDELRLGPFLRHADRSVKVDLTNQEVVDRTQKMAALNREFRAAEARFEEAKAAFKAQKLRIERELTPILREIEEAKASRVQQVAVHRHPDRHDFVLEVFDGRVISEREIEKADTQLRLSVVDGGAKSTDEGDGEDDAAVPPIEDPADEEDAETEGVGDVPWEDVDDEDDAVDEVFSAGQSARRDGVPLEDNPYPEDDDDDSEYVRWAAGWRRENPVALFAEGAAVRESGGELDPEAPEQWQKGWHAAAPVERKRVDLTQAIRDMSPAALDAYLADIERPELFDVYHRICGTKLPSGTRTQSKTLINDIKSRLEQDKQTAL